MTNRLRSLWADGQPSLNGWLSIGCPLTAEIMAEQGYDSICIDLQHGIVDYQTSVGMLQAMRASGVVPLVRVPWLDPGAIMKALDAGAMGIICPMINTAEQAAELVSHMRYPPDGNRSFGPTRAHLTAGPDYAAKANGRVLAFAMVETAQAMNNLDAIAATDGLDGIYVGPADLTLGLAQGRLAPGFDREEPEMQAALKRVVAACKKAGIRAALHCGTPEYAARAAGWGFDMTTVSSDVRLLSAASAASVKAFRDRLTKPSAAKSPAGTGY
ncbi:MAG: 2,4-dihydroxyhept-2-ene-1,7-dioic acid aldolase [Rhizobiaceae bacterium]|nr:2,4-dihydroxyhept-2-ene-1,7-dioic acid aldolase [Rhizobiaceae bacterium]